MALASHDQYPPALPDKDWFTEEEYFAYEDQAVGRWEFVPDAPGSSMGVIRAMSGGTPNHSLMSANLLTSLNMALRGAGNRICRAYGSDLKIHTPSGVNTYPDVSVVCGQPDLYARRKDTVLNPILIAEVLSPSTEAYDRGEKWAAYRTILTLEHYLLIAPHRPYVEMYTRTEAGWRYEAFDAPDALVPLTALNLTVPLAEIYYLVEFTPD